MRNKLFMLVCLLFLSSCMSSNFALTGNIRASLPEDHPVQVVLRETANEPKYEEIGILQIKQTDMDNFSKVIELAKKEARLKGGDILFLVSSDSNRSLASNQYGVYTSESNKYLFVIGKIKE